MVPVDFRDAPEAVKRFWSELSLDLRPYLDPDDAVVRKFGVGLQETGLPVTVLVDSRGIVRSVLPGQVDPDVFASRLDQILRE